MNSISNDILSYYVTQSGDQDVQIILGKAESYIDKEYPAGEFKNKIRGNDLTEEEWNALRRAYAEIKRSSLMADSTKAITEFSRALENLQGTLTDSKNIQEFIASTMGVYSISPKLAYLILRARTMTGNQQSRDIAYTELGWAFALEIIARVSDELLGKLADSYDHE